MCSILRRHRIFILKSGFATRLRSKSYVNFEHHVDYVALSLCESESRQTEQTDVSKGLIAHLPDSFWNGGPSPKAEVGPTLTIVSPAEKNFLGGGLHPWPKRALRCSCGKATPSLFVDGLAKSAARPPRSPVRRRDCAARTYRHYPAA
jgi:hypothetical protein